MMRPRSSRTRKNSARDRRPPPRFDVSDVYLRRGVIFDARAELRPMIFIIDSPVMLRSSVASIPAGTWLALRRCRRRRIGWFSLRPVSDVFRQRRWETGRRSPGVYGRRRNIVVRRFVDDETAI